MFNNTAAYSSLFKFKTLECIKACPGHQQYFCPISLMSAFYLQINVSSQHSENRGTIIYKSRIECPLDFAQFGIPIVTTTYTVRYLSRIDENIF